MTEKTELHEEPTAVGSAKRTVRREGRLFLASIAIVGGAAIATVVISFAAPEHSVTASFAVLLLGSTVFALNLRERDRAVRARQQLREWRALQLEDLDLEVSTQARAAADGRWMITTRLIARIKSLTDNPDIPPLLDRVTDRLRDLREQGSAGDETVQTLTTNLRALHVTVTAAAVSAENVGGHDIEAVLDRLERDAAVFGGLFDLDL